MCPYLGDSLHSRDQVKNRLIRVGSYPSKKKEFKAQTHSERRHCEETGGEDDHQ